MGIRIYDRQGIEIAEVDATCDRSWLLSDVGKAQFTLSIYDSKCKHDILEFGNLIYIEHEQLPPWGGVIDTPRTWGNGTVTVQAYSAEKLLSYRIGLKDQLVRGTTANLIRKIYELVQSDEPLPLELGDVEDDGIQREETINPTSLLDELKTVVKRTTGNFRLTPKFDAQGHLGFMLEYRLNWARVSELALVEGHNLALTSRPLIEQGDIVNELLGYGDGASWTSKPAYTARNEASIAAFGLRQGSKAYTGVTQLGTVQKNSEAEVSNKGYPRQTLDLRVLNVGDAWLNMRLGAVMPVMLHSAGFSGSGTGYSDTVQIRGMEYDDGKQTLRIIAEVQE